MPGKNFYQLLGVKREASQKEIKLAYRRLARKYHPDVSTLKNAEEKFKAMGEAYEILKNPKSRAQYDQLKKQKTAKKTKPRNTKPRKKQSRQKFNEQRFNERHAVDLNKHFKDVLGKTKKNNKTHAFDMDGKDFYLRGVIDEDDALNGATKEFVLNIPVYTPQGDIKIKKKIVIVRIPKGIKEGEVIRLNKKGSPGMGAAAGDCYLEIAFSKKKRASKAS